MDDKYVSKKPNGVANCPVCRGVILRDFKFISENCEVSFTLRCPHCQGTVSVKISEGRITIQEMDKK